MIIQIEMSDPMFERLWNISQTTGIFKRVDPKARWTVAEKKRAVRAVMMSVMSEFVR